MNITYVNKLYLSSERIDKEEIRAGILQDKPKKNIFLIVLREDGGDLMDIIPAKMLIKPLMKEQSITVVGLAKGYRRSVKLVERIIRDVYARDKDLDLHGYFNS